MNLKPLTTQQQKVLYFVETYLTRHGFPPTLRDIGDAIGLANVNAVRGHLLAIEKKGYITKTPDRARSIQIIKAPSPISRLKRKMHEVLKTDEGVFHQVAYGLAWTTYQRNPFLKGPARNLMIEAMDRVALSRGQAFPKRRKIIETPSSGTVSEQGSLGKWLCCDHFGGSAK